MIKTSLSVSFFNVDVGVFLSRCGRRRGRMKVVLQKRNGLDLTASSNIAAHILWRHRRRWSRWHHDWSSRNWHRFVFDRSHDEVFCFLIMIIGHVISLQAGIQSLKDTNALIIMFGAIHIWRPIFSRVFWPTYLLTHVRFCPIVLVLFYLIVSDFCKPTYIPKDRTSYVDGP